MSKRVSCRAIVIRDNNLVTMYREKADRIYYTFPGGGRDEGEDNETCVARECLEEFGITVVPTKHVYTYESEKSIEYFFVCDWVSGEFGTGEGEEFQSDRNRGVYQPTLMNLKDINNLPLMPPEIAKQLALDIETYGVNLGNDLKEIKAED